MTTPTARSGWLDPATAAFVAFPLAVLCLFGTGALSGVTYTLAFAGGFSGSGEDDPRWYVFAGLLMSALIAAVPYLLARAGLGRVDDGTAWWLPALLRASAALAALAVILRLVSAALTLVDSEFGIASLFLNGR
jgi:hypothetical protein